MPQRNAFLAGISRYNDPQVADLPFVPGDLKTLGAALESAGYRVEMLGDSGGPVTRADLLIRLEQFIMSAEPGDELLISLSGHGLHLGTRDYVVPSDAVMWSSRLAELLVPVDIGDWLEQTAAAGVVVLVDACREGITIQTMGHLEISQWSTGEVRKISGLRSAYIYACSKGQYGHFVPAAEGSEGFSLFSRAFSVVAGPGHKARTIGEVLSAIQAEIDQLRGEYRITRPQTVRLGGELPAGFQDVMLFDKKPGPPAASPEESEWTRAARSSELWNLVTDERGLAQVQDTAWAVIRACRTATEGRAG